MNNPLWFRLIEAWCLKRRKTGLTLPFLVGADARSRGIAAEPRHVRPMLDAISTFVPAKGVLVVRWCPWLSDRVFGLVAGRSGTLEFQSELLEGKASAEQQLDEIARNAEILVAEKRFSKSLAGKWGDFTDEELGFIDSVILASS